MLPYASQLFGATPQETLNGCRKARESGYRAVKCSWGPFSRGTLQDARDHQQAAMLRTASTWPSNWSTIAGSGTCK